MGFDPQNADNLDMKLVGSTAKIQYREVQKFFAQGRLLLVAPEQDLVATARLIVDDNAAAISALIDKQQVKIPSDDMARCWFDEDATLWCVVVAPFVLVQEAE